MIETPEKLESLRQKQEEIQEKVQNFKIEYESKMEQIRYAQDQLERREVIFFYILVRKKLKKRCYI